MIRFHDEDKFGVPAMALYCSLGSLFGGGGGGQQQQHPQSYFAPNSLGIAQQMQQGGLPFMQNFQPPLQGQPQQQPMPQQMHNGPHSFEATMQRIRSLPVFNGGQ